MNKWQENQYYTHFACLDVLKSEVEALGAACLSLIDTRLSWLSYIRGESSKNKTKLKNISNKPYHLFSHC